MNKELRKMEAEEESLEEGEFRSPGIFDYLRSSYRYGSSIDDSVNFGSRNRDSLLAHHTDNSNSRRVISSTISLPSSSPTTNHLIPDPYFPSSTEQLQISHNDEQLVFDGNETGFDDERMIQCYTSLHEQLQTHSTNHHGFVADFHSISSTDAAPDDSNEDLLSNEIPRLFSPHRLSPVNSLENQLDNLHSNNHNNSLICSRNWDGALCWPDTPAGFTATLPCFDEFHGIAYDTSRNATRYCEENGSWENRSDYSGCIPLKATTPIGDGDNLEITTRVYFYGYCLSLCALTIAMAIFLVFKELRCLRNTIHTHLIITYILSDTMWIVTSSTTFIGSSENSQSHPGHSNQVSCVTFILLHYFHLTNFFWMFVEGLYLYVLVVLTFVADNIKLRIYACIGWGLPLLVVIGWAIAKWLTQSATIDIQATDPEFNVSTCLWLTVNLYDWIYKAPAILVLASNIIFLLQIMWVLITKLRSATNPETQQSRKAAKALVVLMPLLGITYVLVLTGSKTAVYEYLRALLISTQGFLVALLYCFLNGEVRIALRHRWNRIRTLGPALSCCDGDRREQIQHTRDWRSRTESLRLYDTSRTNRKRDSCISETTTMTPLHSINNGSTGNGSGLLGRRLSTTYVPGSQKYYTTVATKEENESEDNV